MFALRHWCVVTCKRVNVNGDLYNSRRVQLRICSQEAVSRWATYQSPLPSPRPRPFPSLAELPAAAEAKLDVNGEGMMKRGFNSVSDYLKGRWP